MNERMGVKTWIWLWSKSTFSAYNFTVGDTIVHDDWLVFNITHLISTSRLSMTGPVRGWNASQSNGSDQTLLLFTQTDGGEATAAASSLWQYIIQSWRKMCLFHTTLSGITHTTLYFPVSCHLFWFSTCYIFRLPPCLRMPIQTSRALRSHHELSTADQREVMWRWMCIVALLWRAGWVPSDC